MAVVAGGHKIGAKHGLLFCLWIVYPDIVGNRWLVEALETHNFFGFQLGNLFSRYKWALEWATGWPAGGPSGVASDCGCPGSLCLFGIVLALIPSELVGTDNRLIRGGMLG
jgi:hypothetical protein